MWHIDIGTGCKNIDKMIRFHEYIYIYMNHLMDDSVVGVQYEDTAMVGCDIQTSKDEMEYLTLAVCGKLFII